MEELLDWAAHICQLAMNDASIAEHLTKREIPTPAGKTTWYASVIRSILQNEKYRGDALLQKNFTIDFLKKKMKKNEGEVPRYYVHENHEPIIDPMEFELTQAERTERIKLDGKYRSKYAFSSKVICGNCGACYGSKTWHSTDQYKLKMWQCNERFAKDGTCRMPAVSHDALRSMFAVACERYAADHPQIASDRKAIFTLLDNDQEIGRRIKDLQQNIREYDILLEADALDTSPGRMKKFRAQRTQAQKQLDELQSEQKSIRGRKRKLREILDSVILQSYREDRLIRLALDKAIGQADRSICFVFRDGYTCQIDYRSK